MLLEKGLQSAIGLGKSQLVFSRFLQANLKLRMRPFLTEISGAFSYLLDHSGTVRSTGLARSSGCQRAQIPVTRQIH